MKVFIYGSAYFVEKSVSEIKGRYSEFEDHKYNAEDVAISDIYSTIFTQSLFHESKLVIVNRVESIKNIDEFMQSIDRKIDCVVILTTTDTRKATSISKKLPKSFEILSEGKLSANEITIEIKSIFAEYNLNITAQTANQIGLLLNWELNVIRQEASRLSLYYVDGNASDAELLDKINADVHETVFRFIDLFLDCRTGECLDAYSMLPELKVTSAQIFYMLVNYISSIYLSYAVPKLNDGSNPIYNGKTYFMRSSSRFAKRWSVKKSKEMLNLMAKLDLHIKTGKVEADNALLLMIKEL